RVRTAGRAAAFANAYPRGWPGERPRRRLAAPPLAARGADLLDRHVEALREGRAVASEILNDGWIRHLGHDDLPRVTPEEAGGALARIVASHDLTLFAHYATDVAGHRGGMDGAVAALERVDAFLGGLVRALPDDATLLVASDHGNVEDVTGGHTLNPSLGLLVGPDAARRSAELESIMDVAPAVTAWAGAE
ncbi:MAG TPA: alkaline phosphatase family protein, partial [Longimicrobiales bacterium]|nr:alkaline phosphatase family protein [Longimicrobiales bacterium]